MEPLVENFQIKYQANTEPRVKAIIALLFFKKAREWSMQTKGDCFKKLKHEYIMSDIMTPISFGKLVNWMLEEKKNHKAVFGVFNQFKADPAKTLEMFGEKMETPFGPAAGPHTQLAQNIVAAYYSGCRFFELKTVQILDGEDLPVSKPCILAGDEGYNVEWSTELTVPNAFKEYVKGWFLCKIAALEFGLGDPEGFVFNMSVGYDLAGIKTPKVDNFINGMMDAKDSDIFKECQTYLLDHLELFHHLTEKEVLAISPTICRSITLSTLHGCPPEEIEKIVTYLMEEKNINTFIKCNPTLLGYEYARQTMDELGYDYIAFGDFHFLDDLQYEDAVPMIERLQALAESKGLSFGVKITNTFPVDIKQKELPGEEMYMSGRSLFPLSIAVATKLSKSFQGKLRISYSGGADIHNIRQIYEAGIWPITIATTLLKVGGYARCVQIGELFKGVEYKPFEKVDVEAVEALRLSSLNDPYYKKPIKPLPKRKIDRSVPLTNCYIAPCEEGCPIHQDIPKYIKLAQQGKHKQSLEVILDKNPLPFITGLICNHECMTKCTRHFYESPVHIRNVKLESARAAYDEVIKTYHPTDQSLPGKTAIIGGGPAGIALAHFLAKAGKAVTIFEKKDKLGGVVNYGIPNFRINEQDIKRDISFIEALGVEIKTNYQVNSIEEIKNMGYDTVVIAIGAWKPGHITIEGAEPIDALDFLEEFIEKDGDMNIGQDVVIIGAGNTAMDVARAAKHTKGVKTASIVYRRTKYYMPADEEELLLALEDNVEFKELLNPLRAEGNILYCNKVKLGDFDESGRRKPIVTDEIVPVKADTIFTAVGETSDVEFYKNNGITVNKNGWPIVSKELETNIKGVYAIGDGVFGPSVVVKAIANATTAAQAIIAKAVVSSLDYTTDQDALRSMRKNLIQPGAVHEGDRCLSCSVICENCADVCPNRANLQLVLDDFEMPQIIHVDEMCNECGNCTTFCPYSSSPYKDKFTLFGSEEGFNDSQNEGFLLVDAQSQRFKIRLGQSEFMLQGFGDNSELPQELVKLIEGVTKQYAYLLA